MKPEETAKGNHTTVTEFILFGLTGHPKIQMQSASCWLPWRMTATWPFVIHCSILFSCPASFVLGWYGSYLTGSLSSLTHTYFTFHLSFCNSNIINHFFCDIPPLLALSCSDTHINETLLFALCGFIQTITFVFILISYACILCTVLKIPSAEGRHKAFSTCSSHLIAVVLYYGALLFTYLRPSSSYVLDTDKIISVFYTVVFPMLNPLVYSLRNEDVKDSLSKLLQRKMMVLPKIKSCS
ncbi:LOW QUALITY PROTEIN: olfactory receptor 5AS1 [Pogona vitticeps]